jgi:hypothetical protein
MTDPTAFDYLLAGFLIVWVLFVVFGGLAAVGWWLGGIFSTEPEQRIIYVAQTTPATEEQDERRRDDDLGGEHPLARTTWR